eukprot:scaffold248_cov111-Cylindrotheca_fusiformis.AAC.15
MPSVERPPPSIEASADCVFAASLHRTAEHLLRPVLKDALNIERNSTCRWFLKLALEGKNPEAKSETL